MAVLERIKDKATAYLDDADAEASEDALLDIVQLIDTELEEHAPPGPPT